MEATILGLSYEQTVAQLGNPIRETLEEGYRALWYTSKAPTLADVVYLQNGQVAVVSTSYYQNPKKLTEFTQQYGLPMRSVRRYSPTVQDSLHQTVHIWPDKGVTVTTIGSSAQSRVIRQDVFSPTTLQAYLAGPGKYLAGNKEATISAEPTVMPLVTVGPGPVRSQQTGNVGYIVLFVCVVLIIVAAGVWFVRRKSVKNNTPESTIT